MGTRTENIRVCKEKAEKILESTDDLTLLILYRLLHEGRDFRMEGIGYRIEKAAEKV